MSPVISKTIVVMTLLLGSVGFAACGSDQTSEVVTRVTIASTASKAEVDELNRTLWINRTNERIWNETLWVNRTNEIRWVNETNAKIRAEEAAREAAQRSEEVSNVTNQSSRNASGGHSDAFLDCVKAHESDTAGGYSAQNPTSSASGAYQIIDSTWGNYMGYPTAASAPPHIQDERAHQLPRSAWNGSGC